MRMPSPWLVLLVIVVAVPLALVAWRRWTRKAARRALFRFRARVDRFKLTGKRYITESLLADDRIAAAVEAHATEHGMSKAQVWRRVRLYLDEIVPAFNLLLYYQFGYTIAKAALGLFTADASGQGAPAGLLLRVKANGEQVYESLARFDATQNRLVPATITRRPGEQLFLILFGSGLRYAPNSDGNNTNGVAERIEATIGGVNAPVIYAGVAPGYVGLEQINMQIPDSLMANPNTTVTIRVRDVLDTLKQANSVTISIQ